MRYLKATTIFCCLSLLFLSGNLFADFSKGNIVIGTPTTEPLATQAIANDGFYPQLIKEIFKRVGYKATVKFMPFKRIIMKLKKGDIAGGAMVSYREERTKFLIYPNELYTINIKFFGLKDGKTMSKYTNLESFRGSTVGIFRGSFIEKELKKAGVRYQAANTIKQNISKLLIGRVDYVSGPEITIKYLLKNQFSVNEQKKIVTYEPPYKVDKHYVAISKAYPNAKKIVKDFNRGLRLIKKDGTFAKIKGKY